MNDGTIVDTVKASQTWEEATDWNGSNQISRNTRDQWEHETLYRSAKGRYWKELRQCSTSGSRGSLLP